MTSGINNLLVTLSDERSSVIIAFFCIPYFVFLALHVIVIMPYPFAAHEKWAPNGSAAVVLTGCFMICGPGTISMIIFLICIWVICELSFDLDVMI